MGKKPVLADIVLRQARRKGPQCRMGNNLSKLSDTERAEVLVLMESDHSHAAIARALNEWMEGESGWEPVTQDNVARHRHRDCACGN